MKYFATICFLLILSVDLHACKYSVRDVAFVNLDQHSYHLYFVSDRDYSKKELSRFDQFQNRLFNQSNIEFHARTQEEFEDEITLDESANIKTPQLILIDQAGRHYSEPVDPEKPLSEERLINFLNSPLREKLASRFLDVHSTVLLLEGKENKWNKRAEDVILASIKRITSSMNDLPKKIPNAPVLVRISANERKKEKILLWSLGMDQPISEEAKIVILYGRGRKLGPVFEVPGITQTELTHYLNYVGQDCECELERSEMQGVMIPLKWDQNSRSEAKEVLGFNPENEFIKEEVSRILERGSKQAGKSINKKAFQSDPLLGYSEINLQPTGPAKLKSGTEIQTDDPEHLAGKKLSDQSRSNVGKSRQSPGENTWVNSFFITFMIMLMVYLAARSTSPS